MKKFLPLIIITLLIFGYLSALRVPYHFYQEALTEGVSSRFLELRKMPDKFYIADKYTLYRMVGVTSDEQSRWENLHFNDFIVPFPVKHPSFLISPIIYKEDGKHRFGFKVLNYEKEEINRVIFHPKIRFKLDLHKNLLFTLPVFERRILKKGISAIWRDTFQKNIFRSAYLKTPEWSELTSPFNIPLSDMVYDLFLISLRESILPIKTKNIRYWAQKNLGIVEVIDDEEGEGLPSRFLQEIIFFPVGEDIYPIEVRTLNEDFPAEKYRQRLLETLKFKRSDKDSSIPIYASFQQLDYADKFTPSGLTYLFAAFSHQKKSKNFLRQAIRFMERGKNDRIYLKPFYDYGIDVYGSNFSKILNNLEETQAEKLKRKKREEEDKVRKQIEGQIVHDGPDQFESKEQKIKFYLQKAKNEGLKDEDTKNKLILD